DFLPITLIVICRYRARRSLSESLDVGIRASPPMISVLLAGRKACAREHGAQRALAPGSVLSGHNISVAADDDIDGIGVGGIHRGQVSVVGEDDAAAARILLQIFLHRLL